MGDQICMRLVASQHGKFVEPWHNRARDTVKGWLTKENVELK